MPRRANWSQLVVGIVGLVAVVGAALAVLLFARVGALHGDTSTLYAATGAARGISKGSEVWLAGVKVGVVRGVRFRPVDADTTRRLLIELQVLDEYLPHMRRDSRMQIRTGGTLLGAPVVFVSTGTSASPALTPGDTIGTLPQQDPEGLTSNFAQASKQFPAIMADVHVLSSQLRSARGTAGAMINLIGGDEREVSTFRTGASDLTRRATAGRGTLGLAMGGGDATERLRRALARADSVRALVGSSTTTLGRVRGDSTLLRTVEDVRNEVAIARALLAEPRGTAGRVLRDSAIVRQAARTQKQLDSLVTDIKYHPLRYWPF
ncbi:MAG TPA: MlaD family protein [Gemmatimonadaceae bacterium]|nr:MlaD family protein [Gemmatimonadaceae bacterium]